MPLQLIREVEFRVEFTPEQKEILKGFGKKVDLAHMVSESFPDVKLYVSTSLLPPAISMPESMANPQFLQEIVSAMENWFALQ